MGRRRGLDFEEIEKVSEEISQISKTIGVRPSVVSKAVSAQFDFIRYVIQRGDFQPVRLPYIGKFQVSKFKLHQINSIDGIVQNRKRSGSLRQPRRGNDKGIQETDNEGSE